MRPAASRPWWASSSACLVPRRGRDQLAFAVGGRQAGPVGEEGDVVEQRRRVHVGDERAGTSAAASAEAAGGWVWTIALHVGTRAVDPEMEARRRIGLPDAVGAGAFGTPGRRR